MIESQNSLNKAWEKVRKESKVWDFIEIKDQSFYFNYFKDPIFLSSLKVIDLPKSPYKLKFLGRILIRLSPFANIMSRRPGTEEVTFYALLNVPQSGIFGKKIDKKMLDIAAPSLNWRRKQIEEFIKDQVKAYLKENRSFLFLDIGCGAGFDSLEIERIIQRTNEIMGKTKELSSYLNINVDIDSKWLGNNKILTEKLFGDCHNIVQKQISAFDFLSPENYPSNLNSFDNLIISCNGFAEFLSDVELESLYQKIRELIDLFEKNVHIILPFAIRDEKQEKIGRKIGFNYRAKEEKQMVKLVEKIFEGYNIFYNKKYSQLVITIDNLL